MTIMTNVQGTCSPYFKIGKTGITLYQGTTNPQITYTMRDGDMWFDTTSGAINHWYSSTTSWGAPRLANINFSGNTIVSATATDLTLKTNAGNSVIVEAVTGSSTLSAPASRDLHLTKSSGGALYLNSNKWPDADGSANQVIRTNGSGVLQWTTIRVTSQLISGTFTPATGSTTIPYDGSTPLSSEGTQVWSQVITPSSSTSVIKINVSTSIGNTVGNNATIIALFRGSICIAANILDVNATVTLGLGSASATTPTSFTLIDSPASTSAQTYSIRVGSSSGNWYFGRGSQTLNGAAAGNFILEEILI